jgi:hypothetical protein
VAFTPITSRSNAVPSDLQSRLMSRLFPSPDGAGGGYTASAGLNGASAAQVSPTGVPIAQPIGRMPTPSYAPQGAAPTAPAPAAPGGYTDPDAAALYKSNIAAPSTWNPTFSHWLGGVRQGPNQDAAKSLADQWQNEAPIDFSGEGQIGRYYDAARSRQTAMDAAMGRSGGGVAAAGQASLYGSEGNTIGDYVRQLIAQRQQEHEAELNQLRQYGMQISMAELQRKWAKEDSPSFGQELLGVVGGVAGKAAGAYFGKP